VLHITEYNQVPEKQRGPKLSRTRDIENTFKTLIKTGEELFLNKEDRRLMMAIDHAYRIDDYTVRTPYGQSCITCLCTGGKLGLLLLHYSRKGIIPEVSYDAAGENVWKWLADKTAMNISVIPDKESRVYFRMLLLDKTEKLDMWKCYIEKEHELYDMTKEKETAAYERYREKGPNPICGIGEILTGGEFRQRFEEGFWDDEDDADFDAYMVINHCPVLWEDLNYRRHPFHIVGYRLSDQKYEWQTDLACKYSTFLEVLRNHMMDGYFDYEEQLGHQFIDLYSSWFCLLLNCDERWPARKYTDVVLCGVEINPKNKTIEIFANEEAIEIFHEVYQQCQNV